MRVLIPWWKVGLWSLVPIGIALMVFYAVTFQARMESATFNKLTGANTTWWDALWVELRVQESTSAH